MQIVVRHQLSLALGAGLLRSVQHLLLTPSSGPTQTVREWKVEMPGIEHAASFLDGFGNRAHLVSQVKPEAELTITVSGTVETIDRNGVMGRPPGDAPPALYRRLTPLTKAPGSLTSKFRSVPKGGPDRIPLLHTLMERVGDLFGGEPAQTQSLDGQSQSQASGPAEQHPAADYAHAFIGAARAMDIPARYVTGYLSAGEDNEAAFHAWAEAWDDGLGWIAFDPTLGYCPTDRHVRLAVGLDATSTVPVRSVPVVAAPAEREMSVVAQ